LLGAGRRTKDDVIDPAAGIVIDAYLGEVIEPGAAPQIVLHHSLPAGDARITSARAMIEGAIAIHPVDLPAPPPRGTRILEVLR
jgi:thymidine phosphorylase